MSKQSAFDQNHIKAMASERRDILEELHLPPQLIDFLRKNARALQIGTVVLILAILGWTAYDHYTEVRQNRAAALLAEALEEPAGETKEKLLQQVVSDYSGTGAALWGRVQMAHADFQAGNHQQAVEGYQQVLDDVSSDNPMAPLLLYNLAQAYESRGELEPAATYYQRLAAIPGFEAKGHLALGRVYELQGQPAKAVEAYEQVQALEDETGAGEGYVEQKLAQLKSRLPQSPSPE